MRRINLTQEMQAQLRSYLDARVDKSTGCWLWLLTKQGRGYGRAKPPGLNFKVLVHRLAYAVFNGEDPGNLLVCHKCDTPACCNPKHLFLGTPIDNVKDMLQKNRQVVLAGTANGFFGKTHTPKVKAKLAKLRKEEADLRGRKKRIIKKPGIAGSNNPMFGKFGRISGTKNPNATSIMVNNITYETMKAASLATGLSMYKLRRWYT